MKLNKSGLLLYSVLIISLIFNGFLVVKDKTTKNIKTETSGQVSRIIDGDTFDLSTNQRIRLAGANAPEYPKGCLSQEAKKAGYVKSKDCPN